MTLRAIDLCCGAGGWACAARGLPIEFVAVADLDPLCLETWRFNHAAAHPNCAVIEADLSEPDGIRQILIACGEKPIHLILGGIPCEQVSVARGANKASSGQMADWHRLIDHCLGLVGRLAPRWWCVEDVIQIDRHLPTPLELGWEVPITRIDASDFGPQRRLRSFLGAFPTPVPDPRVPRTLGDVLLPGPYMTEPELDRYARLPAGRNQSRVGRDGLRVMSAGEPSRTVMGALDRGSRQRRSHMVELPDGRPRRLTWQEQALLQGFPEDFIFVGTAGKVQKMVGQAIQIDLGRAILKAVCAEPEGAFKEAMGKAG